MFSPSPPLQIWGFSASLWNSLWFRPWFLCPSSHLTKNKRFRFHKRHVKVTDSQIRSRHVTFSHKNVHVIVRPGRRRNWRAVGSVHINIQFRLDTQSFLSKTYHKLSDPNDSFWAISYSFFVHVFHREGCVFKQRQGIRHTASPSTNQRSVSSIAI